MGKDGCGGSNESTKIVYRDSSEVNELKARLNILRRYHAGDGTISRAQVLEALSITDLKQSEGVNILGAINQLAINFANNMAILKEIKLDKETLYRLISEATISGFPVTHNFRYMKLQTMAGEVKISYEADNSGL